MKPLLIAAFALVLAACGRSEAPSEPARAAGVKTAAVEMREVGLTTSAEAVIEAVRQSTVAAQVAGRIVELRFDVGDYVKKGDVIVRIDERAAAQALEASEAQVRQAEAELRNARAQYERSKQLLAQKFLSQAALDKAESDYKAAQERLSALLAGAGQAATERGFATIVAPYSGLVSARHVELGEMAVPGKPLMTGFDPATLRVTATVPQAQIGAIQASGRARVEIPSIGKWIEAKRVTIVPSADPRTHTTQVRLELPPDVRGVYPGIYARAHFIVGREPRLLMPRAAVVQRSEVVADLSQLQRAVGARDIGGHDPAPRAAVVQRSEVVAAYVAGADGSLQLRQIRLGAASDESSVEVLAGLRPGERVALEPLKAAAESGPPAR